LRGESFRHYVSEPRLILSTSIVFFAAHGMVQQASSPRLYRMDLVVITGFSVWFKFIQYTESST